MAADWRCSLSDDDESPELNDESLLQEAEEVTEATACADDQRLNSSPDPGNYSFSSSHWSRSWSKPTEFCRNTQEPQFPPLPEDDSSNKPAEKLAEVTVELSPSSSLSKNCNRAITVRFSTLSLSLFFIFLKSKFCLLLLHLL